MRDNYDNAATFSQAHTTAVGMYRLHRPHAAARARENRRFSCLALSPVVANCSPCRRYAPAQPTGQDCSMNPRGAVDSSPTPPEAGSALSTDTESYCVLCVPAHLLPIRTYSGAGEEGTKRTHPYRR